MLRDEKALLRHRKYRGVAEPVEEDVARVRVGERRGVGACRVSLAIDVHPQSGCMLAVLPPDLVVLDDDGGLRGRFVRAFPGRVYYYHCWDGSGYYFVCANGVVRLVSDCTARAVVAAKRAEQQAMDEARRTKRKGGTHGSAAPHAPRA